jgi:hypothetical protein
MKQIIIFLVTVLIFPIAVISQTDYIIKNGGYRSLEDFKANRPYLTDSFSIKKRKKAEIFMIGGNDYSITGKASKINNECIEDSLWGVYQDGVLYFNCKPLTKMFGYAKVEIFGHYCFLRIAVPFKEEVLRELAINQEATAADAGIFLGGIGAGIAGGVAAQKRIGLVYELQTGKKWLLRYENMLSLLEQYEEIKSDYLLERYPQIISIMLLYLEKVNVAGSEKSSWFKN